MADPRDFGAAGDGQADDTEALQHALMAGDGVLELGKASYRITRPLEFDLARQGYGAVLGKGGTSRLVMAGPGPAIRLLGNHRGTAQPSSVSEQTWQRERFPVVRDVEILGEHPQAVGIELRCTMQVTISQILVRRCRDGIHLVERNRNVVICGSHLYDNHRYGLFFDRCNLHQTIVEGNHISYNKQAGIKSLDGDVHNLQITGNDIEYNNQPGLKAEDDRPLGAEIWFEAPAGIISEVTIASNTIQATIQDGGANVRIHGPPDAGPSGARLITLCGNVLGSQRRGIELANVERMAITGNTIYDSEEWSLLARHCAGLAMTGNTIVWRGGDGDPPRDGILLADCRDGLISGLVAQRLCSGSAESGAGITLRRCHDVAISNCQLLDPLYRGIELEDCQRCRIADNSIIDRRESPSMREAVRVLGRSRNNLIQNNLLGGASNKAIDANADAAIVRGNTELS